MALLFVGGLMSLAWIGTITLFQLVEKTMPWGDWISRIGGMFLIIWGAATLIGIFEPILIEPISAQ